MLINNLAFYKKGKKIRWFSISETAHGIGLFKSGSV